MNQTAVPDPAHVPTLTEVIELLPPTPVSEDGMSATPRPEPPPPGTPEAAPIVTGGLASQGGEGIQGWTPMNTVVLPSLQTATLQPAQLATLPMASLPAAANLPPVVSLADLPVLKAVVGDGHETVPLAALPPLKLHPHMAPIETQLPPDITAQQIAQRVLTDVQKQIDGMLDYRLREAMAPILARHCEALLKDLREELSTTMRDVIAKSVAQEIAKLRQR